MKPSTINLIGTWLLTLLVIGGLFALTLTGNRELAGQIALMILLVGIAILGIASLPR